MNLLLDRLYRLFALAALSGLYSFAVAGGIVDGTELADYAAGYGPGYYVVLWVAQDARRSRFWPAYHYGLWPFVAGVVLVPHYVLRTRGRQGLGLAAALSLVLWLPILSALLGWLLFEDLPDLW